MTILVHHGSKLLVSRDASTVSEFTVSLGVVTFANQRCVMVTLHWQTDGIAGTHTRLVRAEGDFNVSDDGAPEQARSTHAFALGELGSSVAIQMRRDQTWHAATLHGAEDRGCELTPPFLCTISVPREPA